MRHGRMFRKPSPVAKTVKLEVTVQLDMVPGAFHEVEDHVNFIGNNLSYVQSITWEDEDA